MPSGQTTVINGLHADPDNNRFLVLPVAAQRNGGLSLPENPEDTAMDRFQSFDPRYQLEAEEAPEELILEDVPGRVLIHEEIQLTLQAIERLAGQLRQRTPLGPQPRF